MISVIRRNQLRMRITDQTEKVRTSKVIRLLLTSWPPQVIVKLKQYVVNVWTQTYYFTIYKPKYLIMGWWSSNCGLETTCLITADPDYFLQNMICWSESRHETGDTELTQLRSTGDHDTRVQGGPDVLCSTIVSVTDTILSKHYVIVRVTLPSLSSTDIVQMFQIKRIVTRQFSSFWNNNKYNKRKNGVLG